jgi:hypothetical protein
MTVCLHCQSGIVRHSDGIHRSLGWEIPCPFIHGLGNDYHDHHPLDGSKCRNCKDTIHDGHATFCGMCREMGCE